MGVLRFDHPDIEVFIDAKKTPDFKELGLDDVENQHMLRMIRTRSSFGWSMRSACAQLSNFNISAGVTDKFMQAVIDDAEFDLVHVAEPTFAAETTVCDDGVTRYVYQRVRARDLWKRIMTHAYETGDPGHPVPGHHQQAKQPLVLRGDPGLQSMRWRNAESERAHFRSLARLRRLKRPPLPTIRIAYRSQMAAREQTMRVSQADLR